MISLIQEFEADFLWKVSLIILNSGMILKTFTHAEVNLIFSFKLSLLTDSGKQFYYRREYNSIGPDRQYCFFSVKLNFFSYPSILTFVLGAQRNRLIEMVLLNTHPICFG